MLERVKTIAEGEPYPQHLGIKLVESAQDRAVLCLPYRAYLGLDRMHGGAISSLVDVAAVCAFWSHPDIDPDARGATVCFSINFLRKATALDLIATATVRRRGRKICVAHVAVTTDAGEEIAVATVTYMLSD